MPQRLDSFSSHAYLEDTLVSPRPAPGKVTSTQRMLARPSPAPTDAAPVQRELDPVAAAVQRKHREQDLAASLGFLGGPAASIDDSLVQLKTDAHTGLTDDAISAHAATGVAGGGRELPHLDAIQRSFGPHDVSGVRAHVGGAAADAAGAIGAHAYATGNDVAFAREPDLFLAAHEAAHVVQQRQGVHLKGAVGQDGDSYERHADEVAAAVVRGESAADLLGPSASGASAGVQRAAVQRWQKSMGFLEPSVQAGGWGLLTGNESAELDRPDGTTIPTEFPVIQTLDFGNGTRVKKSLPANFSGGRVDLQLQGVAEVGTLLDAGDFDILQSFYLTRTAERLNAGASSPAISISNTEKRTVTAMPGGVFTAGPGSSLVLSVTLSFVSLESTNTTVGISASSGGGGASAGTGRAIASPGALAAVTFEVELFWEKPAPATVPTPSSPRKDAPVPSAAPPSTPPPGAPSSGNPQMLGGHLVAPVD